MIITPGRCRLALTGALLAGLVGCGDKVGDQVAAMNKTNLNRVTNIYEGFQNTKGAGRGPKDEAELVAFIKEYDPAKLKMMGIDPNDPAKIFVSERDGKPFKVRYGVGGSRGAVAPITFEQEGKDGKRQVGFTGGKVEEVANEAEYQALLSGKSSAPATRPDGPPTGSRPGKGGAPPGAPTGPPKS